MPEGSFLELTSCRPRSCPGLLKAWYPMAVIEDLDPRCQYLSSPQWMWLVVVLFVAVVVVVDVVKQ